MRSYRVGLFLTLLLLDTALFLMIGIVTPITTPLLKRKNDDQYPQSSFASEVCKFQKHGLFKNFKYVCLNCQEIHSILKINYIDELHFIIYFLFFMN